MKKYIGDEFLLKNRTLTKQIGDIVLAERKQKGLTQEQLAEKCGLSNQTIANIEQGRNCKIESFVAVIKSLGLSADFILGISNAENELEIKCRHLSQEHKIFLLATIELLKKLDTNKTNTGI